MAGSGTIFKSWTGCTTVTGNECHVNMATANQNVTADFALAWLVKPTVVGGTWSGNPLVEDGQTGTITIIPPYIGAVPTLTTPTTCAVAPALIANGNNWDFTTDPMSADCAFTVTFPSPQLKVTKSGPANATVGTAYSYTILVENTGAVDTTAAATVSDMVPAGLTISSAPGCTVVAPLVTCTVAVGLVAGGNQPFTINVNPTVAALGTVNNIVSVSGGGDTACPVANPCRSNTVSTTVGNLPALSIVKAASAASTVVGLPFDYTLTVSNSGTPTTATATVDDDVPVGLVINSATGGAGCSYSGQAVTCTVASGLTSATPTVFTINVTPMAAAGASVANSASVSGGGDPACPVGTPCGSNTVTTALVSQNPVLELEKTAGAPTGNRADDTISYSFKLTNAGNVALSGVALNDPLLGGALACPANTLAVGATMICGPVLYMMTQGDVDGGQVQNTATASGLPPASVAGVPPTPVTGTDSTNTPIAHAMDQLLVKAVTADSTGGDAAVGDVLTYTVTLTNKSNATLLGVVVSDPMITPGSITCASVAPDASCELVGTYTVTQADADAGMVHNTAVASGPMCAVGGADPRCTTTVATPVVSIIANDDETTTKAATPVTTPVTGNDTATGGAIDPGSVAVTTPSPNGTLSVDPATGAITFTPAPGFTGTTSYTYRVCLAAPNGTVCDTATVTVVVVPLEIVAVDDVLPPVEGSTDTTTVGNVYDNDTLEGDPIDPSQITGTVTKPATPISGGQVPTLDPTTGVVSVPPGTPAGEYTIEYRICEMLYPDNCDDATVTVTVTAPLIEAVEDTSEPLSGDGGGNTPSVLDNDRLGGKPIQPGQVTLTPGMPSHQGLTMNPDGTIRISMLVPLGTYTYPYTICEVLNPGNCSTTTATVIVTGMVELRVVKTSAVREVRLGDLVRYTLTVENTGNANLVNGNVIDTPPAGFSYVEGSLTVADGDNAATVSGQQPLRFNGLDVPAGGKATLVYLMRVGAGVRAGTLVNQAQAYSPDGEPMSNVATAEVMLVADPLIDDSLVFGTVFNDRDGDGWQDGAALSGVKVQGGFAAAVYVANSTTVDRGAGMQPEADASSPLLHGIAVGAIAGRQSEADLPENQQVVIRQTLRELSFTDDFVLTSDQGVTLRMDRNGTTTVEKNGDAAKGLNAAAPTVERRIGQSADGYVVDYVVSNAGIDERGIPGVRIASVEGLLIETDQFGRYHLAGVNGGAWERGRSFILKVDPSTLSAGTEFSTDNPLLRRVTPGVPVRFDWGVKLPVQVIEGGSRQEELEMGEVFFAPDSAEVQARYQPVVEAIAGKLREHPKAEVVIQATANSEALAFERVAAIKAALLAQLDEAMAKTLVVTARTTVDEASSLVAGVSGEGVLLGTVLFDTDKAVIRPEFDALLDKVAAALEQRGGGSVSIVGHTDVRASHAYNTALGLSRAKAVFDALASRLSPAVRSQLRVETDNAPAASAGKRN
ncbi:MAG: OmpA family protein [Stenotrophomonas sp.]